MGEPVPHLRNELTLEARMTEVVDAHNDLDKTVAQALEQTKAVLEIIQAEIHQVKLAGIRNAERLESIQETVDGLQRLAAEPAEGSA